MRLAKESQEAARKARQEKFMADLRAKGLIKEKSDETDGDEEAKKQYEALQNEQTAPWLMIVGVIVGMLALMAALGGIVVWVILKVYDEVS